jgi:DNA-binding MarR family transcriptional regulator
VLDDRETAREPDEGAVSTTARAAADPSWRYTTVGRYLHNAARKFDARVLAILADRGWGEVRLVHVNLTRCLDFSGTRLTELAKRAAMTKQAMGELVDECERIELVVRTADPTDGRAKIVVFTARGKRFMSAFRDAIFAAEEEMAAQLGEARMRDIKQALADYAEGRRSQGGAERAARVRVK